jgi:hypothetical protein
MKYHFIPARVPILKQIIKSVGENKEKLEPGTLLIEMQKWYSHPGKQCGTSSVKHMLTTLSSNSFVRHLPK